MNQFKVAFGESRQAKKWRNSTITWEALRERLSHPLRTAETISEYQRMKSAGRSTAKDKGGFVAGELKDGLRKAANVMSRSMLTMDLDHAKTSFLEEYTALSPYSTFIYSTHSHSRGVYPPRLRRGEIHGRIETTEWQKYCIEKAMLPPETAWIDASTVESTEQNGMTIDGIDTETDEELTKDNPPMDNPFFRPVGEPIKTTYITRENHYGNIIRKLYEDNGGRPGYVTIIDETDEPFVITREKVAEAIGDSKLLVLDPIYPFIDGDLSSNKSVARAMDTLEVVAHETGAAILLLNNLTKYNTSDYSSGLGASNLKNIARSLFKLDRQGPLLYLEGIKNNFARYDGRIGILMDDFGRPDYINYNQMMREVELMQKDEETGEFSPARQRAADFIMNLLANGPVDSNEVKEAADQEEIPMSTLNEVKKMLGIRSQRTKGNSAVWVLPD